MADSHRIFGFTDEQLATLELSWRPGLFDGQVVLVSGAGTGLGKAIAYQFGRLGAKLVICGRKPETLEWTAQGMRKLGIECLTYPMTIRDPEQVAKLFDAAWSRYGALDVLVNNAGGQFPQPAIDFSVKGWNAVIDTNLNGAWYMMQAAARHWRDAARPGCIVNIVAVVERGMPGIAHTAAARAGVIYLEQNARRRMGSVAHQGQQRRPRSHRHRGNECLSGRGEGGVRPRQPDDEIGRRAGCRRCLLLPGGAERQIHYWRGHRGRRRLSDVGRAMDGWTSRLLPEGIREEPMPRIVDHWRRSPGGAIRLFGASH